MIRVVRLRSVLTGLIGVIALAVPLSGGSEKDAAPRLKSSTTRYGQIPIHFEVNRGQAAPRLSVDARKFPTDKEGVKVAVMGQSCGGFLSITLGADPRVKTIGVFNSGITNTPPAEAQGKAKGKGGGSPQPGAEALTKLHGPVLLINGHEPDFAMPWSVATFEAINNLPVFYGSRHNAGHTATVFHPGGGEFANVASNWLMWTFKGDKKAGKMFTGKNCSLCTNSNWDVKSKGIK